MTNQLSTTTQQDAVYALAESNGTLFAARLSGLYRSDDGGASWHNTFESLDQLLAATAVAVSGNTVFAGVNGAVLRSEDAGTNWQIVGLASPAPHVVALAISPTFSEDGFIAAGTAEDGVFISNDGGLHWTAWNFGLIDQHCIALAISPDFAHDRTLFVGTESGIFRSQNGGKGWQELAFPMASAPVISLAISPNFVLDGQLYAGTEHSGLYTSDDRGITWQLVANTPTESAINALQFATQSADTLWLLLEDQVLQSFDGGASWQQRQQFSPDQLAMTLCADSATTAWVGFADGSVLKVS
jgi:photosystem II stability/assembly factor-like uncharacterized protein